MVEKIGWTRSKIVILIIVAIGTIASACMIFMDSQNLHIRKIQMLCIGY